MTIKVAQKSIPVNHKGEWCKYQVKFCQEGICKGCEVYQDFLNSKLERKKNDK